MLVVHKRIPVADDGRVLQPLEGLRLQKRGAPVLRLHDVHALQDVGAIGFQVAYSVDRTLRPPADAPEGIVAVRLQCARTGSLHATLPPPNPLGRPGELLCEMDGRKCGKKRLIQAYEEQTPPRKSQRHR